MKIALFNAPSVEFLLVQPKLLPYGLGILASFLRQHNYQVSLDDLNARIWWKFTGRKERNLQNHINAFYRRQILRGYYKGIEDKRNRLFADSLLSIIDVKGCNLAGISVFSRDQMLPGLFLAEVIKKICGIPVVVGGPHVTANIEKIFKEYPFIDFAISGEGEEPLLQLAQSLDRKGSLNGVASLFWRNKGDVKNNERMFYDIEQQPLPDYQGLNLDYYFNQYPHLKEYNTLEFPYAVSRGCFNQCNFCFSRIMQGKWQNKSVKKVVAELTFLKSKYRAKYFLFTDLNLTQNHLFLGQLCESIIKEKLNIMWRVNGHPVKDNVLLSVMQKAGCRRLMVGMETASNALRWRMAKYSKTSEYLDMFRKAKALDIKITLYLIYGYPYETLSDIRRTLIFIRRHRYLIDFLVIYKFVLDSVSPIFAQKDYYNIRPKSNHETFFTYWYDAEETKRAQGNIGEFRRWRMRLLIYRLIYFKCRNRPNILKGILSILTEGVIWASGYIRYEEIVFYCSTLMRSFLPRRIKLILTKLIA